MKAPTAELVSRKHENERIREELERRAAEARGLAGSVARSLRAHGTTVSGQLRAAGVSAHRAPIRPMQRYSGERSFPVEAARLEVAGGIVDLLPRADLAEGVARIRLRVTPAGELPDPESLDGLEIVGDHRPPPTALVVDAHAGTLRIEPTGATWQLREHRPGSPALDAEDAVGLWWALLRGGFGIQRVEE